MKSESIEDDFSALTTYPEIRYSPNLSLSRVELHLLSSAFAGTDEIFVEQELHAGFSGARVLLVRPGTGRAQEVVKLGPPPELRREWLAYRNLVADYSPQNTARILDEPLLSDNEEQAVLRYSFAGGDPRQPACSLRTYFQEQGGSATVDVLNRVIRVYGRQWWSRNVLRTFTLSQEYDRLLPVHLKVKVTAIHDERVLQNGVKSITLLAGESNMTAIQTLSIGQPVQILNFTIGEVRPDKRNFTLTTASPQSEASANLRIRMEDIDPTGYRVGDQVMKLDGVITATRQSLLVRGGELGLSGLTPEAREIHFGELVCPNPLYDYTKLLDHITDSRISIIHGDFNLENIVVDRDTGFAWLIDFSDTRRGPTLFDLQRMEAQVISKLLPP